MRNNLRGMTRVTSLVLLVLAMLPLVLVATSLRLEWLRGRFVQFFYALCAWMFGLRITTEGTLAADRPLMLVSNHISYMDVFALGRLAPISFTPKKEVRSWPVIGWLCVLADCVFVERRPREMEAAAEEMGARLAKGKVLCLFPEGTTSDGIDIKPFKSGFFSLAQLHHLPVQPVTIAYTHIGAEPITPERREEVAWVGEATFFDHFWHVLTLPSLAVTITLHPAIADGDYADRKALSQACEAQIAGNLQRVFGLADASLEGLVYAG